MSRMAEGDGVVTPVLEFWSVAPSNFMREIVAKSKDIDIATLYELALDKDARVSTAAINNPLCPEWLKVMLS